MNKLKLVILSGAGLDAESGIETFRDAQGLWNNHSVDDVATPMGWLRDQQLVLDFYNTRRAQLATVKPNLAHELLVKLEEKYDVYHITQNVSDLLERAGCANILHLHGQLVEAKSSGNDDSVKNIGYEPIKLGDLCEEGYQMRPNVVWFGEMVPKIGEAEMIAMKADILVVIGTSMQVYPAANLLNLTEDDTPIFIIDPNAPILQGRKEYITVIKKPATQGVAELVEILMN